MLTEKEILLDIYLFIINKYLKSESISFFKQIIKH